MSATEELRPGQQRAGAYIVWLIPTGTREAPVWLVDLIAADVKDAWRASTPRTPNPPSHSRVCVRHASTEAEGKAWANRTFNIAKATTDPDDCLGIRRRVLESFK